LGGFSDELRAELEEFTEDELRFNERDIGLTPLLPSKKTVYRDVLNTPMVLSGQSVTLAQAERDLLDKTKQRINSYISAGFYQGQPTAEIARNIRDTAKRTQRSAEAIARTATNHLANEARQAVYEQSSDLIIGYIITATLDVRTTDICKGFDSTKVRLTDSYHPQPPFHYNCRTTTIAWLDEDDEPPQNYYDWLKKQPAGVQDEALGKQKGLAFRNAGLTTDEFREAASSRMNQPLTLDEMRAKNEQIDDYLS